MFPAKDPALRMRNRRAIALLLIALLTTFLCLVRSRAPTSALSRGELAARDLIARSARRTPANPQLIFLAIDSESISLDAGTDLQSLFHLGDKDTPEARALGLMSEHWPWPRSVYALILERLLGAGAKVVAFDLIFPTPSADDDALRAALERYGDRVVVGSNFLSSSRAGEQALDASLTLPAASLIPQTGQPDSRIGYVNFWPGPDGVIREAVFKTNFSDLIGAAGNIGDHDYLSLTAQAVRKSGRPDLVPADTASRAFRFTDGPGQGFAPHSIFEIFVPEYWTRNYQSGAVFDGAIVIVGSAGNWQHDEHLTPFGTMSGPEIQLNVLNALLHGEFFKTSSALATVAIYLSAGLLAAGTVILCPLPMLRFGLLLLAGGAWAGAQFPLVSRFGFVAPVVGPLAVVAVTGLSSLVYDFVRSGAEQLRLRLTLQERQRSQEMLVRVNGELEQRVQERTTELTDANSRLSGSLEEKSVLLKEIHHRVKNNLQVISSLLNLQAGAIKDPVALQAFTESRSRVRSMALIHEKLYQSQDLACIDFEDYIQALTSGLMATFGGRSSAVRIAVDVERIMIPVDSAVPCGLIVNELVTNCFKYAFGTPAAGEIRIGMKRTAEAQLQLTVSDNGAGFPKDVDFRNTESLGLQLVTTLTEQLDGTIAMRNGSGTTFEITIPEAQPKKL